MSERQSAGPGGAPARDGDIAVREEFDEATRRNTAEAFELFIRRHPDHPLVPDARQRAAQLRASGR